MESFGQHIYESRSFIWFALDCCVLLDQTVERLTGARPHATVCYANASSLEGKTI